MATTPTAKRRLLGHEIRHMLNVAGLTQSQAAEALRLSQQRIANVIRATGKLSYSEIVMLATKLGFDDPDYHSWLADLSKIGNTKGYWDTGYRRAYRQDFRGMVSLEADADLMRIVGTEVLPDIFQTEAFIRRLFSQYPEDDSITLDEYVQARLARTEALSNTKARFSAVLSESCLHPHYSAPSQIMREQLDYLIELSNRPNIQIQVLPFNMQGRERAVPDRFQLIRIPSRGLAGPLEIVYEETAGRISYIDDALSVAAYQVQWDRLTGSALGFPESRRFMRTLGNALFR